MLTLYTIQFNRKILGPPIGGGQEFFGTSEQFVLFY